MGITDVFPLKLHINSYSEILFPWKIGFDLIDHIDTQFATFDIIWGCDKHVYGYLVAIRFYLRFVCVVYLPVAQVNNSSKGHLVNSVKRVLTTSTMGVKTVSFFVTWAVVLASGKATTTEDDREFRETNLPSLPPSIEGKRI